jgi:hypothetical protein
MIAVNRDPRKLVAGFTGSDQVLTTPLLQAM